MFEKCNESMIYCINEENTPDEVKEQLSNFPNLYCSDTCYQNDVNKIIPLPIHVSVIVKMIIHINMNIMEHGIFLKIITIHAKIFQLFYQQLWNILMI